jgi:hypothetical protein
MAYARQSGAPPVPHVEAISRPVIFMENEVEHGSPRRALARKRLAEPAFGDDASQGTLDYRRIRRL